jgi:hypothetical protein
MPRLRADVDEDGADRTVTDLVGDFLGRGQAGEVAGRSARLAGRLGCARLALRWRADAHRLLVAAGGAAEEPGFECRGAEQTAGEAGEDQGDVAGAEDAGDEGEAREDMRVCGVLLEGVGEVPAVGDQRAEEAEDLADASRLGPIGIGLARRDRCSGGGCHERNKNTEGGRWARKKSWSGELFLRPRAIAADRGGLPVKLRYYVATDTTRRDRRAVVYYHIR